MYYTYRYDVYVKAHEYKATAQERIHWVSPEHILFTGNHHEHHLHQCDGQWVCDCSTYRKLELSGLAPFCQHSIAVEKYLAEELFFPAWDAEPKIVILDNAPIIQV